MNVIDATPIKVLLTDGYCVIANTIFINLNNPTRIRHQIKNNALVIDSCLNCASLILYLNTVEITLQQDRNILFNCNDMVSIKHEIHMFSKSRLSTEPYIYNLII